MSADNGVYILESKGPEFRVIYTQGIDNIYGTFNDSTMSWDGDPEMMLEYFGASNVFSSLTEALDHAEKISENYDYLEYGVCVISDFKNKSFGELTGG